MNPQVQVKGPRGEQKIIDVCQTKEQMKKMTVLLLKKIIIEQLNISGDLRMVFKTHTLEESKLLSSYNIKHMSTIHTLLMLPGGN
ncbi:unnamed protein product [Ophioblennius macclurei]